jgi:hypothetical protein
MSWRRRPIWDLSNSEQVRCEPGRVVEHLRVDVIVVPTFHCGNFIGSCLSTKTVFERSPRQSRTPQTTE